LNSTPNATKLSGCITPQGCLLQIQSLLGDIAMSIEPSSELLSGESRGDRLPPSGQPTRSSLDWDGENLATESRRKRLGQDGVTYPIGFIQVTSNQSNGHAVGGLLVADNTGIPLEFVVTTAVRPSRAQQILYGNRLRSFIAVNLCAVQLLASVKTRPSVIFVRDEWMLALHSHTEIPVLALKRSEELGSLAGRPTVIAPQSHPEYADIIDLTSLDADMIDAFDRIEKCREVLAARSEDYKI
jgi:hypothetical protein